MTTNDHPFSCTVCGSNYTNARYAARCCRTSCVDQRDGTVTDFSEDAERRMAEEWERKMEAEMAEYVYECSCGEHYKTVEAAMHCRKCRTYTDEGWCSEVVDTRTNEVVLAR